MESRSTFVTVIAWIFIVGAGFASFVSILQAIMVSTLFSGDEFQSVPDDAPAIARFMFEYFHLMVYGFCALSIFTFVAAIALLKRKNWARLIFIGLLSFGVLWQIGGLIMQLFLFPEFPAPPEGEGFEEFERMGDIMLWFSFALAAALSGLLIWIIKKLVTQPIVSEFTVVGDT
ncbi:hypothetical protein C8D92_105186 [Tamilnaduibacter salinus]|uniref:Uncharacterized protein n=2 Tax=Tamilnaduibacter salinus TaxID=1484056 RepID=A0A2U1CWV8_9GAMM|nr:hypothetical protein C8D92_105186 [Tamilnaduibacter salinus]